MTRLSALAFAATLVLSAPVVLNAQNSVPPGQGQGFKDTSMLKLPAGQRAAIFDFEDLECPACSHAFPVTHTAVEHYKIPLYRHDFLIPGHQWSRDAAITARYLQDKVSPEMAEKFRGDVFAAQQSIASKDDLQAFTQKWFGAHGQQVPFAADPSGRFMAEIQSDITLGERLGVHKTPTIVVLSPKGWTEVVDLTQLYVVIDAALAETPAKASAKPATKATAHKSAAKS
jgi:protein-disulfide isomerase